MRPARIILLLVALVAGGLAAFLATRGDRPAPAQVATQVVEEPRTQILVAKVPIGVAERLTSEKVEWVDWPEGAVREDYVTISAMPDAPAELTDAVTRFEFFPGEPIREAKLVRAEQGYLSAVLAKGKRGVSIPVSSSSASGGFIVPNDRVDVILTRGADGTDISETVLFNVKVLAIGNRLGELGATGGQRDPDNPRTETFSDSTIATLELDPLQGETLINAASVGSLSLALRSMADFNESPNIRHPTNQPIRVIGFGNEQSVISGTATNDASAQPASFDPDAFQPEIAIPGSPPPPPPPPAE